MNKYKFKVKKILENTIETNAKNYNEAIAEVTNLMLLNETDIFEKLNENDTEYEILLVETEDKNNDLLEKNKKFNLFLEKENIKEIEENIAENNEKEDKNSFKVICDKCGNCIDLSEDFG